MPVEHLWPTELSGDQYVLASVNGRPLPVTLWTQEDGASATLVAEALAFGAGDRVERRRVIRQTSAQGVTTTEATTLQLAYRRTGPSIEIGCATAFMIRCSTAGDSASSVRSGSTSTNSSANRRAMVSVSRTASRNRRATLVSTASQFTVGLTLQKLV